MRPRYAAVIFDMDGVIVDSEVLYCDELRAFSAAFGLGITEEVVMSQVGASHQEFQKLLAGYLERSGRGPHTPQQAEDVYESWAAGRPRDYASVLNPGVPETLETLREAGVRIALASSAPMHLIDDALSKCGLTDAFELIVSGEQFREGKPNPAVYLHTLARLGLPAQACCCVEDSVPGIAAGKAAGLTVYAKREERFGFSQDEADCIIDEIPDLLPHVLG